MIDNRNILDIVLFPNHFDGTDRNLDDFYHPSWKRIPI